MSVNTSTEAALADLPARIRVHDLARRAGLTSKEMVATLAERGIAVTSAASSVDREAALPILAELLARPVEEEPADTSGRRAASQSGGRAARQSGGRAARQSGGRSARSAAEPPADQPEPPTAPAAEAGTEASTEVSEAASEEASAAGAAAPLGTGVSPLFLPPEPVTPRRRSRKTKPTETAERTEPAEPEETAEPGDTTEATEIADGGEAALPEATASGEGVEGDGAADTESADTESGGGRRRRRRGRRGRGRTGDSADGAASAADAAAGAETDEHPDGTAGREVPGEAAEGAAGPATADDEPESQRGEGAGQGGSSRRRRRRRKGGGDAAEPGTGDDPDNTVVHVRSGRSAAAEVQGVRGSTRLEAKRQRRRESRESRRRPQILTEAEFLARRESVDRVMAIRQRGDLAQVALLEDGMLVEHFVSQAGSASLIGNVYLGRVQNVLPSMEAAFVDIGRGRNAVLYAGEVNWDLAGLEGKSRRIEMALSSGDAVLVQASKDPIGHKGARLTTQISLPGRFLVYVPGGGATGISRKLPDTERKRLKAILDRIVPEGAGVIIRTAAEGVAEEELAHDVERLKAQWEQIVARGENTSAAPALLSAEPDTLIKVIRDLFNSDINHLIIDGDEAWESVTEYVGAVAPELADRVTRYEGKGDVFAAHRIDEQISKALQRKVHLPSGGSLVIDRTEAMTVIDVNTGKFTGSGGNLEETVTKNNLEAAEEIVRQLRLRDIGGIIVVDFIDMVLESNRDLVLRRLTECLGRDRTRHQVAEVTSLGLVQMTRKRLGTGLVEAFSEPCPECKGRGIILHDAPAEHEAVEEPEPARTGRRRRKGGEPARVEVHEPIAKITIPGPPDPRGPKPRSADREDAQLAEQPAAPDGVGEPAVSSGAPEVVSVASGQGVDGQATQSSDVVAAATSTDLPGGVEPARGRPRRRAATRPAGAPSASVAAVDIIVEPASRERDTADGEHAGGSVDAEPPVISGATEPADSTMTRASSGRTASRSRRSKTAPPAGDVGDTSVEPPSVAHDPGAAADADGARDESGSAGTRRTPRSRSRRAASRPSGPPEHAES